MWSRRLGCPRSAICKLETQRSWRWWCRIRGRRLLNQQHGCGRVCRPEDPTCGGAVPAGPGRRLCSSGTPSSPCLSVLRGPGRVGDAPPHWGPVCVWADRWLNCALPSARNSLPDAQKSCPTEDPGSCDPVNPTQNAPFPAPPIILSYALFPKVLVPCLTRMNPEDSVLMRVLL